MTDYAKLIIVSRLFRITFAVAVLVALTTWG
jgi:hypothetical protein